MTKQGPHPDGHIIAGIGFILWGLIAWVLPSMWSLVKVRGPTILKLRKLINSKKPFQTEMEDDIKLKEHLQHYTWLPQPCCSARCPFEPLFKIIFPTIGIVLLLFIQIKVPRNSPAHVELAKHTFDLWSEDGTINGYRLTKFYHTTLYLPFLVSGIVDILVLFVNLPQWLSPVFLFIAFIVQGLLFNWHVEENVPVSPHIHSLLTTAFLVCIILSLVRVLYSSKILVNLGLGCSITLLGVWFMETGYILNYNHQFRLIYYALNDTNAASFESSPSVKVFEKYITICFAFLLVGVAAGMVVLWMVLLCVHKGLYHWSPKISLKEILKVIKGHGFKALFTQFRGYQRADLDLERQLEENETLISLADRPTTE